MDLYKDIRKIRSAAACRAVADDLGLVAKASLYLAESQLEKYQRLTAQEVTSQLELDNARS